MLPVKVSDSFMVEIIKGLDRLKNGQKSYEASDIGFRGECIEIQWPELKWENDQLYSVNGESSSKYEGEMPLKVSKIWIPRYLRLWTR